jgi:D-3-phosphoglycerate dehydrogenase
MGSIWGETLGLVAFGNIAQATATRAQALGMDVIAFDPYTGDEAFARLGVGRVATLPELLERSDYVSVHTPLTPDTRHLLSDAEFARMKPSAYVINTSRGPVIDEEALIRALQSGAIAGAGLDVFEKEPLPAGSPLAAMDNVVLTPHSASYSDKSFDTMKERVGRACVDLMNGRWPEIVHNRTTVAPRLPLA